MSRIRNCKFKGLYFVLLLVFGFALPNHSTSSEEICSTVNDQSICYFKPWDFGVDWDTAWQLCNSRNSTLPVIRNRDEQGAFAKFLNVHMSGSVVWTSGRNFTYDDWTWVDGRRYSGRDGLFLSDTYGLHQLAFARATPFSVGLLIGDLVNPRQSYHYACQYSGSLCNQFSDAFTFKNGCIRYNADERSWYDARNQCLMTGGDLAVLDHDDRYILRDHFKRNDYWIGLRTTSWRWNLHQQAREEDEIKYTNWFDEWNALSGNCISIDVSSGKWKAIGCSEKLKVVCQRDFVNTTSSKSHTGLPEPVEQDSKFVSYATFISVALGGICVVVILNIVVVLVVRKYFYRNARETRANRCYYELETTRSLDSSDNTYDELDPLQPVYEEVYDNVCHL